MKIKLDQGATKPTRAHPTDAGLDLCAMEDKIVPAHGSAVFDTGVHVQMPPFTAGLVKSRSGLMTKHDITTDGVIDESYTGSIHVKLFNHSSKDYQVARGDRIAQLLIVNILTPRVKVADELPETDRGVGGFGSTGR